MQNVPLHMSMFWQFFIMQILRTKLTRLRFVHGSCTMWLARVGWSIIGKKKCIFGCYCFKEHLLFIIITDLTVGHQNDYKANKYANLRIMQQLKQVFHNYSVWFTLCFYYDLLWNRWYINQRDFTVGHQLFSKCSSVQVHQTKKNERTP